MTYVTQQEMVYKNTKNVGTKIELELLDNLQN